MEQLAHSVRHVRYPVRHLVRHESRASIGLCGMCGIKADNVRAHIAKPAALPMGFSHSIVCNCIPHMPHMPHSPVFARLSDFAIPHSLPHMPHKHGRARAKHTFHSFLEKNIKGGLV